MDKKRVLAGIQLLDDPDNNIYQAVRNSLIENGREIIPLLEKTWEGSLDPLIQERIEDIIKQINTVSIHSDLEEWLKSESPDLITGAWLVARTNYPDLEQEQIREKLEKIRSDIWLEFNENLTGLEKVRILNHFMFKVFNFFPNTTSFFAPQNCMINLAMETGKCNPVMLGIIYQTIASDLEMPVYGVDLPNNFILAYIDHLSSQLAFGDDADNQVLFYINPFNRGAVFGRTEIDQFLAHNKTEPKSSYYVPCSPARIIYRLCDILIISYEKIGYAEKAEEIKALVEIIEKYE